jgi:uncharacterized protein YjbI with pentapeptide repeats
MNPSEYVTTQIQKLRDKLPVSAMDKLLEAYPEIANKAPVLSRTFHDKLKANLEGVDLNDFVLDGVDLMGANLKNASLMNASLKCADLRQVSLEGAHLDYAHLEGANLGHAKLKGAILTCAYLQGTVLKNADLREANLRRADLTDGKDETKGEDEVTVLNSAAFHKADLRQAKLRNLDDKNFKPHLDSAVEEELEEEFKAFIEQERQELKKIFEQEDNHTKEEIKQCFEKIFAEIEKRLRPTQGPTVFHSACFRSAKLEGTDLSSCVIEGVYVGNCYLDRTRLQSKQIIKGIGEKTVAENMDKSAVEKLWQNFISKGSILEEQFKGAERPLLEDLKEDLEDCKNSTSEGFQARSKALLCREARNAYVGLKQNFDALGDYEGSAWAYIQERNMEKLEAWYTGRVASLSNHRLQAASYYWKYVKDLLAQLVCRYGEDPWRVFRTILLVFVLFASFL